jgi:hypothetical protein
LFILEQLDTLLLVDVPVVREGAVVKALVGSSGDLVNPRFQLLKDKPLFGEKGAHDAICVLKPEFNYKKCLDLNV